jgi:hypothetical protein
VAAKIGHLQVWAYGGNETIFQKHIRGKAPICVDDSPTLQLTHTVHRINSDLQMSRSGVCIP